MSKPFKLFGILAIGKRLLGLVLYLQCNKDWLNFFYIVKLVFYTDSFFSLLGARVGMKGLLKLNCTRSCWNTSAADNKRRQILQCLSPKSPWVLDLFWVFFFPLFFLLLTFGTLGIPSELSTINVTLRTLLLLVVCLSNFCDRETNSFE